ALHFARDGAAGGFDLARGDALRLKRLQAKLAEIQRGPRVRQSLDPAFEGAAELGFLGLHHGGLAFRIRSFFAAAGRTAAAARAIGARAIIAGRAGAALVTVAAFTAFAGLHRAAIL